MTSDTFATKYVGNVYAGGDPGVELAKAGETGIKPGMVIRVVNGVAYLAKKSDDYWSGIAALKVDQEIDTAYSLNERIEYYPAGQDTLVWVYVATTSPSATISESILAMMSTTDGMVTPFAYEGSADDTNTLVGRFRSYLATSTSDTKLAKVWLGSGH